MQLLSMALVKLRITIIRHGNTLTESYSLTQPRSKARWPWKSALEALHFPRLFGYFFVMKKVSGKEGQ